MRFGLGFLLCLHVVSCEVFLWFDTREHMCLLVDVDRGDDGLFGWLF